MRYLWPFKQSFDFKLGNSVFAAVKLTSINFLDMVLDLMHAEFFRCLMVVGFGKNLIIFSAETSSSVQVDNRKKDILILGKDLSQGLDDTTLTAEKNMLQILIRDRKKFCLCLHYNGLIS